MSWASSSYADVASSPFDQENITEWPNFKARLKDEFSSIEIFGCDTHGIFNLLPHYESVQEVAEDLAPKIRTLKATLEIVKQFHDMENLYSVNLNHTLNSNIIRTLPNKLGSSFNNQYMEFQGLDQDNVKAPATFQFLSWYVNKL